jgi:hypothetical protein
MNVALSPVIVSNLLPDLPDFASDGEIPVAGVAAQRKQTQPSRNLNYWALWAGYKF